VSLAYCKCGTRLAVAEIERFEAKITAMPCSMCRPGSPTLSSAEVAHHRFYVGSTLATAIALAPRTRCIEFGFGNEMQRRVAQREAAVQRRNAKRERRIARNEGGEIRRLSAVGR